MKHIPVLLNSVLDALGDISSKTVVDCTFGAGGYSRAFLEAGANVIAFDRDSNVLSDANAMVAEFGDRFRFIPQTFSHISDLDCTVDAIVFDLGISATWREVGVKYRALAKKYHPDTATDKKNAATEFAKISTAYDILKKHFGKK